MGLDQILERRNKAHERVIKALAHLPRDLALSIVLSWISIDHLEKNVIPTICKGEK